MSNHILISPTATPRVRHAAADIQRYIAQATGAFLPIRSNPVPAGIRIVLGHTDDAGPAAGLLAAGRATPSPGPEGYTLRRVDDAAGVTLIVAGADEAGAVYGAYALLETAYGCSFFLGSEIVPAGTMPLDPGTLDLQRTPAFATRGLLPWYDFLSGPSAWNLPDYRLYVDRMIRMGLNTLGLHVYSKGAVTRSQGAEPFLSFTYRGVGHAAEIDTTQTARWGYQPMRVSDFAYGTDRYFAGEVFGPDAAIEAAGPLDAVVRAKKLLQDALTYAKERGLRIVLGFEPAAIPAEILEALPSHAKSVVAPPFSDVEEALDLQSEAAREILRLRLDDLLTTYPMVDAIWLWQNEDAAWTALKEDADVLSFDPDYLNQAYDHLREHAPQVQLVVSGWGAVHAHFDSLHTSLPEDVPFSALNHYLGTGQTDEVYGHLGGRSRWPIPWLEDDATLWEPQFHLHRFANDIARAHRFGCDGMIGIHWRTRAIDHNAAFFARALWQPDLDPAAFATAYATALAGADHGPGLGAALAEIDRAGTWPGRLDEENVSGPDWNHGHSNEAGRAFLPLPTPDQVVAAFAAFVARLDAAAAANGDPATRERVAYHHAQAAFAQTYVRSQRHAAAIDALVASAAADRRRLGPEESAQGIEHLVALYDAVRDAIAVFAVAMTTTADLGVLASLNQKYVQRACWQRHDALREVVADPRVLPRPDLTPSEDPVHLFVPVPPETAGTVLEAIIGDPAATSVTLYWTTLTGDDGGAVACARRGRGVWRGVLPAAGPLRYWLEAHTASGQVVTCPPGAPAAAFTAIDALDSPPIAEA